MQNLEFGKKVVLIDPVSPEVNRGSFCYLSYLLYGALSKRFIDVRLLEEFTVSDMDDIDFDEFDQIYIALWSYPQIETCLIMQHFLKGRARFYGYFPLINSLGLPKAQIDEQMILDGMKSYPDHYEDFNYLLLSDCDKHIKDDAKRSNNGVDKMHPLFTSYGCPMGCKFCSATVNHNYKRTVVPIMAVKRMIQKCAQKGIFGIHFTDEDFFFDPKRAIDILKWLTITGRRFHREFEIIALGHLHNVNRFINFVHQYDLKLQTQILKPLRLIEIGLESGDADLAQQMGKRNADSRISPHYVHSRCPVPILWLTMTFYPGETIRSIYNTGRFMETHGLPIKNMSPRIVTNGTVGGLGQFFQYYDGVGLSLEDLRKNGIILSNRPMRLIPSYIPHSFLTSLFSLNKELFERKKEDVEFWADVYGLTRPKILKDLMDGRTSTGAEFVLEVSDPGSLDIQQHVNYTANVNNAIYLAVLARLGIAIPRG